MPPTPANGNQENRLARQITLLSVAAFASAASARIGDPLLPQLASDFAISSGEAAHAVSAFALAYGVLQLCYGPLGDRYGKYRVITLAAWACLLGVLGSALAVTFPGLVAFRFLTGATAAALIPLSMAWIADQVPYQRRQHVLAYFLSGQILGVISGQGLGGLLADLGGWRGAFYALLAIYLAVAVLLLAELRRSPDIDRPPHDESANNAIHRSFASQVREILSDPRSRRLLACVGAEGALLFGALAFIPTYLHQRFGLSLALAGGAMALFGVGGLCYTSFAKALVQKQGERRLATGGGLCLGVAFLLLLLGPNWLWVLPAAALAGFGFYMLHNTLQINATQMAPAARGTAVSLFASCFFLGQSLGVWCGALVMDRFGLPAVFAASALLLPGLGLFFGSRLAGHHTPN